MRRVELFSAMRRQHWCTVHEAHEPAFEPSVCLSNNIDTHKTREGRDLNIDTYACGDTHHTIRVSILGVTVCRDLAIISE